MSLEELVQTLTVTVKALQASVESMHEMLKSNADHISRQDKTIAELTKKIEENATSRWPVLGTPAMAYGQPPLSVNSPAVTDRPKPLYDPYWTYRSQLVREEAKKHGEYASKKKRVVIERLPIETDVEALAGEIVAQPTFKSKADYAQSYRHKNRDGKETKIAKIEFRTEEAATEFMKKFRTLAPDEIKCMKPMPFARRDMTPVELQLQHEMRTSLKEHLAKKSNDDGTLVFYRDLEFFVVKKNSA